MTLTPATQAKLDQAFADLASAQTADAALQTATDAATVAAKAQADATSADNAAHVTATGSAHDALAAIAGELGFPLPGG